jgi:cyclophilin family peptidyl-prolyl cis-trans isomerase
MSKVKRNNLLKRWMLFAMKKASSIVILILMICLASVSMAACGKVKPLTQGDSIAPSQTAPSATPTAAPSAVPAESACAKTVQASPNNSSKSTDKSWKVPPAMTIDVKKTYCAVVQTNKGSFTLELFAKDAPKTVNNFVFLAKNNFYNGIIFHRIIETFMIQTGDPQGTGMGGPGYQFEDELNSPYKYEPGTVAMANAGPNTNGSQFFICTGENSKSLPNQYSIFAKVAAGMDTVKKIAATPVQAGPTGESSSPTEKVMIENVQIVEL